MWKCRFFIVTNTAVTLHPLSLPLSPPSQVTVCKDIYYLARKRIFQENPDLNRAQLILEVNNPFIQVGHNVYILAHQLSRYNPQVAAALKQQETDDAIVYYKEHTAQIEVRCE